LKPLTEIDIVRADISQLQVLASSNDAVTLP
jgi:hypothetical protein